MARKPSPDAYAALPRAPITVVLDDVRSLANVGLIFRLCDALRVERLYLCGITGHPPYPDTPADPRLPHVQERAFREIQKTAVMAIPFVPWEYAEDAVSVVRECQGRGYQAVAIEQSHDSQRYDAPGIFRAPICLILGHERAGVAPRTLLAADLAIEVPVFGMANSLNVATALAVVGYEILRQHDWCGLNPL